MGSREGENEREQRETTDRFFKPPPSVFALLDMPFPLLPSPSSLRYPCLSCARRGRAWFVLSSVSSVSGARRSSVAVDINIEQGGCVCAEEVSVNESWVSCLLTPARGRIGLSVQGGGARVGGVVDYHEVYGRTKNRGD